MSTVASGALPTVNFMSPPEFLSISVAPTTWPIGQLVEGEFNQSSMYTITNDGSISGTFTLNIDGPSSPSNWLAGTSASTETYVMSGLFGATSDDPTGLFSFDDVMLIGTPSAATSTQFGNSSLTLNGVDVGTGEDRGLWFEFEAPTSTNDGGVQQAIAVTVGVQEP